MVQKYPRKVKPLSRVHARHRRQTDRRMQTDRRIWDSTIVKRNVTYSHVWLKIDSKNASTSVFNIAKLAEFVDQLSHKYSLNARISYKISKIFRGNTRTAIAGGGRDHNRRLPAPAHDPNSLYCLLHPPSCELSLPSIHLHSFGHQELQDLGIHPGTN